MAFTPLIAWTTNGVRQQLLQYARSEGETPERLAGDLIVEAMRARHAPPADFTTAPVEHKGEWSRDDEDADEDRPIETKAVQPKAKFGSQAAKRARADAFLRSLLADGPRSGGEVKQAALAAGFAWTAIHAAAERLRVDKHKAFGSSSWTLPG
ncbi:hypothetical protein [Paraburkholderia sp. BR14320]|uniref:hypothetical protein n=1 Tax=unclassified Paraburkholderia TaxID=2615204 RepID=UPI0034CF2CFE